MGKRIFLTFALIAMTSAMCRADIVLGFSPDGLATNFNVQLGQTVQVPLYLVERPGIAPSSGDILANFGIVGAGVRVDYSSNAPNVVSGTAASMPAGWFQASGASPPYPRVVNNPGGLTGNLDVFGGTVGAAILGTPSGAGTNAAQFGTLTFQANALGVTTLTTSNTQPSNVAHFNAGDVALTILEHQNYGNIFWVGGNPANAPLHYSSTITVTPAPEPVTILGVCAAAGGLYAWRRSRSKKV